MQPLEKAIDLAGSQSELARLLSVNQANVWNWLNRDKNVPSEFVLPIAKALNFKVTPHELRPDIYPHPSDGMPKGKTA